MNARQRHTAITIQPLSEGPPWICDDTSEYAVDRFKVSAGKAIGHLDLELHRIGVTHAVIEMEMSRRWLRQDGWMRADAKTDGPRVRLTFRHPKQGPLSFSCDTYGQWASNVRAIGLTLESLRAVERYGAVRGSQQYTGFRSLPGGGATLQTAMALEQAAAFVAAGDPGDVIGDRSTYRVLYRERAKALHPDAGGTEADFRMLQEAKRVLDTHHDRGVGGPA